jgi:hypothetical protein
MIMIMSMGRDYVSELRPPTGLLFIPQVIYEHGFYSGQKGARTLKHN